jgi:hypothetical protein
LPLIIKATAFPSAVVSQLPWSLPPDDVLPDPPPVPAPSVPALSVADAFGLADGSPESSPPPLQPVSASAAVRLTAAAAVRARRCGKVAVVTEAPKGGMDAGRPNARSKLSGGPGDPLGESGVRLLMGVCRARGGRTL